MLPTRVFASFFGVLLLLAMNTSALAVEVDDLSGVERVYGSVAILDIDAISSASQSFTVNYYAQFRWHDPALAHDGPGVIRRKLGDIPAPRILILNEQRTWSSLMNVVDISPEGDVTYRERLWGDFSQPLRLHDFPFDAHTFEMPIIALRPSGRAMPIYPDPESPAIIADRLSVADWSVTDYQTEARDIALTTSDDVEGLVVSFRAKRIYNHHVIKYIVPLLLIVAMSWVVFWIDPTEASSQLSVAVTAALTLIAYHIALAGKLPDIPYLTRMDLFLFCSTLIVFAALLEVVLTSRLARDGREVLARRFDMACRLLFPAAYLGISAWALAI